MSMRWPQHEGGLIIQHNDHKGSYISAEEWALENDDDWVSPDEREKAIETDSIWSIQWYPHTPVGFNRVLASTFEACLGAALREDAAA
jgi:hypothetical protein